ncbi:ornithine cyclodeaminase family protein [Geodermatophilus sp. DSM 44513]|uniref:ornithine cyclodeaminase family protein n=1 Tax=Geodermatophilus sp. DSM 44513 TaxID=1528104 RepID=UPI001287C726|nr:ornithine cyclodeaminase family protein [Geodermatophilus sp. DSM 44513]WNV77202.1 ornithine cyclodeaminase family protein [Geodermatophilus sp. DSM 44513]
MRYLDADAVAALGPAGAVRAISDALRGGLDPAADPPRVRVDLSGGQFLLMPAETPAGAGVKVATVAPGNPARGLPRIQAAYLLFDRGTLALRAVLDGTALTALRTPAVSVAAVLARLPERPLRVAVVGAGPQATGHVATLAAVRPLARATHLVRDPSRTPLDAVRLGSAPADDALRTADVVVCATSARTPLFDSTLLRDDAVVVAVGSHEPDARELDAALLGRASVVVEDVATALREAGDVVLAIAEGALTGDDLVPVRDVVTGAVALPTDRPVVVKSVGMSWEDLVVAEAVLAAH